MNDRAVNLFDQYDVEIVRTWKGRGAFLCESDKGLLILKEYPGPSDKIMFQDQVLKVLGEYIAIEEILPNKEGELLVEDQDKIKYVVKTYFDGRECNQKDCEECQMAMELLAKLHEATAYVPGEVLEKQPVFSLQNEYEKHNRELKRVRRYLREKSQKSEFELYLLKHYDYFFDIALQITEELSYYSYEDKEELGLYVCHGDYQYHNILQTDSGFAVVNLEKCIVDYPVRDLYLFMRKLLEKNNWSVIMGENLLKAYERNRLLTDCDYRQLYYRLAYPEKFWKIVNFYYNSGKAWIPGRNMEKIEKLILQEKEKQIFLETLFG